ncbi:MAG: hypothetical protein ABIG67_06575 [Pseudomonadota bacterium]
MKTKFLALGFSLTIIMIVSVILPKATAQHRRPPREAIEACTGKKEGDPYQFESPHGTVYGTCRMVNGILACVPDREPDTGRVPGRSPGSPQVQRGMERDTGSTEGSICKNPKSAVSRIVDTGQNRCYGNKGEIPCPGE